jgi:NikR C terminal nickel binding domain/Branched-chain amino acid ATP-binding cassette transporter
LQQAPVENRRSALLRRRADLHLRPCGAQLPKRLTQESHDQGIALATLHVHLDHDSYLEVTVVKGKSSEVKAFADRVIAERGCAMVTSTFMRSRPRQKTLRRSEVLSLPSRINPLCQKPICTNLARMFALAGSPKLLFLDEPGAGLNHAEKDDLVRLLKRLKGHGLTIFVIDHDMAMVEQVADHITVLNFGRRIADGAPGDVLRHPEVIAAYLGEERPALAASTLSRSTLSRPHGAP